jgi:putative ABC transport system substrate-binding protein
MTIHSRKDASSQHSLKNRGVAVLLLASFVLTGLGWTAQSWAQANVQRVGILTFDENAYWTTWMKLVRHTLADQGWVEGKNVSFEYRNAHSDSSRFTEAAEALVGLKVDVILAPGAPAVRAAFAATRTIPIVTADFTTDPVAAGYVQSYARPGGNVTGVFLDAPELTGKWLELLTAMIPNLSRLAVLWDPGPGANHLDALRNVAGSSDIELQVLKVRKPDDIDKAFTALHGQPQAVIILPSPMIYQQSAQFARLALKHRLPATAFAREFALAGGALAYGPDVTETRDSTADLVAKILGGAKPGELPVQRPSKIRLVVNLKTAKALGITVPQSILLRADEVIR